MKVIIEIKIYVLKCRGHDLYTYIHPQKLKKTVISDIFAAIALHNSNYV